MSYELDKALTAAIGFNDGANKGFWRVQPREKVGRDAGQWIEMGAELRMFFKNQRGEVDSVPGRAVGSTGSPDGVRVLVQNQGEKGVPDGIYGADTANVRIAEAILPEEALRKQGIKSTPKITKEQEATLPNIADLERADITDEDIRLINEGIDSPEAKEQAEYKKSVEAEEKTRREPTEEFSDDFSAKRDRLLGLINRDPESLSDEELNEVLRKQMDWTLMTGLDGETIPTPQQAEAAKRGMPMNGTPTKESLIESNVDDLFADVEYNGDTDKTVDDLLNVEKEESISEPPKPVKKNVNDLQNGDIIYQNGQPSLRVISNEMVNRRGLDMREIRVQRPDGTTATLPESISNSNSDIDIAPFTRPDVAPRRPRPAQPAPEAEGPKAPEAEQPAAPAAPAEKPKKVKPVRKPKAEKVNLPNRKDDGKAIAPAAKSEEELRDKKIDNVVDQDGKLVKIQTQKEDKDGNIVTSEKPVEDPNAIIDALLEENPNAKIQEDGTVVMERGEFTDADGKTYGYEVAVQRTVGNQFMERYRITDPETGEVVYELYNADYKDSFAGLYGKTNGLTVTRDYLLGRKIPGKKGVDAEGVPVEKELRSYFGPGKTIENRLKYLRKTSDTNNWRLLTIKENISKFLTGRGRALNKSDAKGQYRSQFGNVRRSFLASFYEAIDLRDDELIKERLVQLLGRMPDNPASVDLLLGTLREEINRRYAGTSRIYELRQLPNALKKWLEAEDKDLRDVSKIPFVSEDGVSVVKPGMKVRFINNEGDMVVGTVVKLNAGSGRLGGYKDTARIKFGDRTVDNLQTRNMLIMEDDEPTTDYKNWVRLDEKLERRAAELGISFDDYIRRRQDNPDYDPEGPEVAGIDAAGPYLGEAGEAGEAAAPEAARGTSVGDLEAGDAYYGSDGEYLGTVIDSVEVPATDGSGSAIAITYLNAAGEEEVEIVEIGSTRGPK